MIAKNEPKADYKKCQNVREKISQPIFKLSMPGTAFGHMKGPSSYEMACWSYLH